MAESKDGGRRVSTVDTMFDILEKIREKDGASVLELAEELDIARSTVHDHLTTLHKREIVVNKNGTYYIGLKFLDYGKYAKSRYEISEIVQPTLDQIAKNTGELVWFGIEEHGKLVQLNEAVGEVAVSVANWIGERVHLHTQAVGKSILAHLSEERVHEIVDRHGLPARTNQTITDREELLEELEQIRGDGIAFNDQEYNDGVRAVGSPVIHEDEVLGAVSVSGPANRLSGSFFEEELPNAVQAATNEIELKWISRTR